jgi:hypothetical protein
VPGHIQLARRTKDGSRQANTVHFLHFARKYGCKSISEESCATDTTLAVSPPVLELERKLFMDVGDIHTCEFSDPPCYDALHGTVITSQRNFSKLFFSSKAPKMPFFCLVLFP